MLEFLQAHSSAIYVAELFGLVALFLLWESRRPFIDRPRESTGGRHVAHLLLLAVNQPVGIALGWLLAWQFASTTEGRQATAMGAFAGHEILQITVGFLALDLTQYVRHRIMHLGWFWRVHKIHHSDREMDWSTEFRFHPVEILMSIVLRVFAIVLVGIPSASIAIYAPVVLLVGLLQHANVRFSDMAEAVLGKIVVTPALHRVHHANEPQCYNRNFAVIFIWWDMLFGSYRHSQDEREFGLNEGSPPTNKLQDLLLAPFRSSR